MIELYIRESCPFCQRVIGVVKELNLQEGEDYVLIDATQGTPGREKVLDVGGRGMVPFMIDGDANMYESADIIGYIREKFN
jgi:glutaredoxin 2